MAVLSDALNSMKVAIQASKEASDCCLDALFGWTVKSLGQSGRCNICDNFFRVVEATPPVFTKGSKRMPFSKTFRDQTVVSTRRLEPMEIWFRKSEFRSEAAVEQWMEITRASGVSIENWDDTFKVSCAPSRWFERGLPTYTRFGRGILARVGTRVEKFDGDVPTLPDFKPEAANGPEPAAHVGMASDGRCPSTHPVKWAGCCWTVKSAATGFKDAKAEEPQAERVTDPHNTEEVENPALEIKPPAPGQPDPVAAQAAMMAATPLSEPSKPQPAAAEPEPFSTKPDETEEEKANPGVAPTTPAPGRERATETALPEDFRPSPVFENEPDAGAPAPAETAPPAPQMPPEPKPEEKKPPEEEKAATPPCEAGCPVCGCPEYQKDPATEEKVVTSRGTPQALPWETVDPANDQDGGPIQGVSAETREEDEEKKMPWEIEDEAPGADPVPEKMPWETEDEEEKKKPWEK